MRLLSPSLFLAVVLGAPSLAIANDSGSTPPDAAPQIQAGAAESPLGSDQLLSALGRDLQDRFGLIGELQLEFANAWTPPDRVAKSWHIAIVEYPSAAGASMLVRFRVLAGATPVLDTTAMLRASLWRDAWFAQEPLAAGSGLDASPIEARRIDSFRLRDAIPTGKPDPDLVLSRSVQAGTVLTWRDVSRRPLVRKGEIVEVCASEGLLSVTMKGLALQNGCMGDIVSVRNPESMKTIPALVVAENRVEVRL
jgi:flagellar basal body P-ring formation protein FlgA